MPPCHSRFTDRARARRYLFEGQLCRDWSEGLDARKAGESLGCSSIGWTVSYVEIQNGIRMPRMMIEELELHAFFTVEVFYISSSGTSFYTIPPSQNWSASFHSKSSPSHSKTLACSSIDQFKFQVE